MRSSVVISTGHPFDHDLDGTAVFAGVLGGDAVAVDLTAVTLEQKDRRGGVGGEATFGEGIFERIETRFPGGLHTGFEVGVVGDPAVVGIRADASFTAGGADTGLLTEGIRQRDFFFGRPDRLHGQHKLRRERSLARAYHIATGYGCPRLARARRV